MALNEPLKSAFAVNYQVRVKNLDCACTQQLHESMAFNEQWLISKGLNSDTQNSSVVLANYCNNHPKITIF